MPSDSETLTAILGVLTELRDHLVPKQPRRWSMDEIKREAENTKATARSIRRSRDAAPDESDFPTSTVESVDAFFGRATKKRRKP